LDSYWVLLQAAGVPSGVNGYLQFKSGSAFAGDSGMFWSEDSSVLVIGANEADTVWDSGDPAIVVRRTATKAGNGHAFVDESDLDKPTLGSNTGYNSYDHRITVSGTSDYDHFVGFQAAATFGSTGAIDRMLGVTYQPTVSNGGTVDKAIGYRVNPGLELTGGTFTNYYGFYISETLNKGDVNYAIYFAGTTQSYFGGNVGVKDLTPDYEIDVAGDINAEDDIMVDGIAINRLIENEQTGASYTLVLTDKNKVVKCDYATAFTLTVPPNADVAFPIGTVIIIEQWGAGQVTVAEGAEVTVNSYLDYLSLKGIYATASLRKDAENVWILSGLIE